MVRLHFRIKFNLGSPRVLGNHPSRFGPGRLWLKIRTFTETDRRTWQAYNAFFICIYESTQKRIKMTLLQKGLLVILKNLRASGRRSPKPALKNEAKNEIGKTPMPIENCTPPPPSAPHWKPGNPWKLLWKYFLISKSCRASSNMFLAQQVEDHNILILLCARAETCDRLWSYIAGVVNGAPAKV